MLKKDPEQYKALYELEEIKLPELKDTESQIDGGENEETIVVQEPSETEEDSPKKQEPLKLIEDAYMSKTISEASDDGIPSRDESLKIKSEADSN